jgi:hypothetical protein
MQEQPCQPGEHAAEANESEVRDRGFAAHGCHCAAVHEAKLRRRIVAQSCSDRAGDIRALLHSDGTRARQHLPALDATSRVTEHEDVIVSRDRESRRHGDSSAVVGLNAYRYSNF